MSNQDFDPLQLNESQRLALGTYTAVTNQEPAAAVPLLQRSEWNVQVRHTLYIMRQTDEVTRLPSPNSLMVKPQTQSLKLAHLCHPPLLNRNP